MPDGVGLCTMRQFRERNFSLSFAQPKPIGQQNWHIRLSEAGAQAICEAPKTGITFDRKAFAAAPASPSYVGFERNHILNRPITPFRRKNKLIQSLPDKMHCR